MRRWLALLLLCCLLLPAAQAETFICPKCYQPHEITFLQKGDIGIAVEGLCKALARAGYLPPETHLETFNDQACNALKRFQADAGLPVTGMADDETLSWLLHGMSSADCAEAHPDFPSYADQIFWVPTDGGIRVHIKACCCDMYDPRAVSLVNATAMEIMPCGICARKYKRLIDAVD